MTEKPVEKAKVESKPLVKIDEKIDLMNKMHAIEVEHSGFSQVPLSHPVYWELKRRLDALQNK